MSRSGKGGNWIHASRSRKRERYLDGVYEDIARLLGAIDRNPFRPTYGCMDRQYWHYRTACFPSEMYQEGVLPLTLVYAYQLPETDGTGRSGFANWRWQGCVSPPEAAFGRVM